MLWLIKISIYRKIIITLNLLSFECKIKNNRNLQIVTIYGNTLAIFVKTVSFLPNMAKEYVKPSDIPR